MRDTTSPPEKGRADPLFTLCLDLSCSDPLSPSVHFREKNLLTRETTEAEDQCSESSVLIERMDKENANENAK